MNPQFNHIQYFQKDFIHISKSKYFLLQYHKRKKKVIRQLCRWPNTCKGTQIIKKGQGRPLPSGGTPLTNLTAVKLSRKRCPKNSSRTCVESNLCKVHLELYIPPLTQPTNNAPDLYHFTRLGVLCWFEMEQSRMLVCWLGWSDLLVWFGGGGLIWWADFGGLVWRWSGVGVGAWSDLWSDLRLLRLSGVVVWSEVDFMV